MFTKRTTKPAAGNKFYITTSKGGYSKCIQGSPTDSGCNVLANCVGYACGRFNEIIGSMKYPTLNCNAENFIERAKSLGLKISDTPTLGGIMVWQKGATLQSSDGAGHVAVVEEVYSDGSIITSESGYGCKTAFWTTKRTNSNGRWGASSGYTFRGCIINPSVTNVVTPVNNNTTDPKDASTCPFTKPTYTLSKTKYQKVCNTGVKWLQWYLYKLGLYKGNIDGYFGEKTESAVKTFQAAHCDCNSKNLVVDGTVGALTREAIVAVYGGKPLARINDQPASSTFKVGDKIKLASDAKYYSGGKIPSWVFKSTLYCRSIKGDKVVISTLKSGAVTGTVNKKFISKA